MTTIENPIDYDRFGETNQLNYDLHNSIKINEEKEKKEKKEEKISASPFNILQLMLIFIGVYLNCETLKISKLIKDTSYNAPTIGLYAYDLLFSILIAYPLVKVTNIMGKTFNSVIYLILCNSGGLGFALLGEVPFLKNVVLVKGFWNHLTPQAIITIIFFTTIIIGIGIREIISAYRYKTLNRQLLNISVFIIFYVGLFYMLADGGATDIHWHIHHAICAGFLSLWFINWTNMIEMCLHAIMMGIVIEGINFYGIQELYLFLSDSGSYVQIHYACLVSACYLCGLIIFKICNRHR